MTQLNADQAQEFERRAATEGLSPAFRWAAEQVGVELPPETPESQKRDHLIMLGLRMNAIHKKAMPEEPVGQVAQALAWVIQILLSERMPTT